jgi:Domain of unknown function (DUF5668)
MTGNKIAGLILVLLGVAFLAHNLGWFSFSALWKFWPVVLIGLGASMLFGRR